LLCPKPASAFSCSLCKSAPKSPLGTPRIRGLKTGRFAQTLDSYIQFNLQPNRWKSVKFRKKDFLSGRVLRPVL